MNLSLRTKKNLAKLVAFLASLLPAVLVLAGFLMQKKGLFIDISFIPSIIVYILVSIFLLFAYFLGLAKCSISYPLASFLLWGVSFYVIKTNYGNISPMSTGHTILLLGLSALWGAIILNYVYGKLEPKESKVCDQDRDRLNPRCATCRVNKVCAFRPGGVLDLAAAQIRPTNSSSDTTDMQQKN